MRMRRDEQRKTALLRKKTIERCSSDAKRGSTA